MSDAGISPDKKRDRLRRLLVEGFDEQDMAVLETVFADEVAVMEREIVLEPADFLEGLKRYYRAFPDLRHDIHGIMVDSNAVAVHYRNVGTFENELVADNEMVSGLRVEPTGDEIEYRGVYLGRFEGDEIVAWANYPERLEMFQSLGVMPSWDEVTEE